MLSVGREEWEGGGGRTLLSKEEQVPQGKVKWRYWVCGQSGEAL